MSFTRFHDDPCRIEKQLDESTFEGRYRIDKPGNGLKPCFMEDPYIRLQQWGANLQTNTINLESELLGLTRPLTLDCPQNKYNENNIKSQKISYPSCAPFVEQPRATNPAWTALDLEQNNFDFPLFDPQANVCLPFHNNLSSRILEKDYYLMKECLPKENLFK